MTLNQFLYPQSHYNGEVKPQNLVFNANLQEFSQKVGYIANLETNGKLSPQEAYQQIRELWQELETSYQELGVNQ
ncbi:MAG: hypothetical protein ACLFQP_05155 [Halothece sp.]